MRNFDDLPPLPALPSITIPETPEVPSACAPTLSKFPTLPDIQDWLQRLGVQAKFEEDMRRLMDNLRSPPVSPGPCEDVDPPYVITYTGKKVFLDYPSAGVICLEDITHALARITRCTGHGDAQFSVAQHSVVASWFAPDARAAWALFHDAHEAYLGDVSAPLRRVLGPHYAELCHRWDRAIAAKFDLMVHDVQEADVMAMAWERDTNGPRRCSDTEWFGPELMKKYGRNGYVYAPLAAAREVWPAKAAEFTFLNRASVLGVV